MRAAVWFGRQNTKVVDVPDAPSPGPGEVKIKVGWVGVCGTDLHEYNVGPVFMPIEPHPLTGKKAPLIQGHEFAGVVVEVGEGVTDFKPGDRVTSDSATWCGECWACQRHEYSLCEKAAFLGLGRDGVFAEYTTIPVGPVLHIPDHLSLQNASFAEPTAVAVHALRKGQLQVGENVVVVGAGNQGLLTYQILKHAAVNKVFVVARKGLRANVARSMGATVLDPTEIDVVAEIKKQTGGLGADLVIETAAQPETIRIALQSSRTLGRIVQVGFIEEPVLVELNELLYQERHWIGILNNGGEMPEAVQFLADGRVDPTPMISNRISLEDVVEKGLRECIVNKRGNVKVIVNCNADLWDA